MSLFFFSLFLNLCWLKSSRDVYFSCIAFVLGNVSLVFFIFLCFPLENMEREIVREMVLVFWVHEREGIFLFGFGALG